MVFRLNPSSYMQRQQLSARWAISEMTALVTCQRFSPVRQYSWSLDDDDDDDDGLEVWSNVRVGGNRFLYVVICTKMVLPISIHECLRHN